MHLDRIEAILGNDPNCFRTPCFIYDTSVVAQRYLALRSALGTKLFVSLKANPTVDLSLRLLTLATEGWEVASLKELNLVAANKSVPIFVNNPAMTPQLMRAAIGAGARLVLDNPSHVSALLGNAGRKPVEPVLLRANSSSVLAQFAAASGSPRRDHFGMDWATLVQQAVRLEQSGLAKLAGFHVFCGSNTFARHQMSVVNAVPAMIEELEMRVGHPLTLVNLGGGFGENWDETATDLGAYREALSRLPRHLDYAHEAGRAIFASCGVFLTRVLADKSIDSQRFFICDGGLAQDFLLCGTETRLGRRRTPRVIPQGGRVDVGESSAGGLFVGGSCSQDDVLGLAPEGQRDPQPGDLVAFEGCGAYHATYPNRGFLGLEAAASYVLP